MKVLLLAAITIDGRIARSDSELINWTSKEDKEMFVRVTKEAGVMVMGRKTFETFPKPLPGRLHIVMTREKGSHTDIPGVVEFTEKQPKEILGDLAGRGFETVVIAGGATINTLFLREGLLDEVWLTVEPKAFGEGVSVFNTPVDAELFLIGTERINANSVALKYHVGRPRS